MIHMRPFTSFEKSNMEYLVNHNVKFTQVQVTATGLKKSILDATTPMRTYFKENNVHDYELQAQGPENKVTKKTYILTGGKVIESTTSLYRPVTKEGDPRLWIYRLKETTEADDIHAITASQVFHIPLDQVEMEHIRRAVDRADGNLTVAARMLGVTRQTLYNKLNRK